MKYIFGLIDGIALSEVVRQTMIGTWYHDFGRIALAVIFFVAWGAFCLLAGRID
jgi:hypothetical protein